MLSLVLAWTALLLNFVAPLIEVVYLIWFTLYYTILACVSMYFALWVKK